MASRRCKTFVQKELNKLGVYDTTVELGEVELNEALSDEKMQILDSALKSAGLELMKDKQHHLVEKMKAAVHELVYHTDDLPKPNYSEYISEKVNLSYTVLSNTFSKMQGITIEKYIIRQRIERVKELLIYTDINLSEMAFMLHYSSVSHLSNQFKKFTGITPSFFRKLRNPLTP